MVRGITFRGRGGGVSSVILGVTTGVSVSSLVSVDPVFLRFRGAGIRGALIIFAFLQGVESIF